MNFSNLESIKTHIQNLSKLDNDSAFIADEFENIKFNGFIIKICGGQYSHSLSKVNSCLISDFSHLQVVIEEELIKEGLIKAIYPLIDSRFNGFSWTKYFCYYNSNGRLNHSYMGMMIPLPEVYQLIRELYKISCLKSFF